MDLDLLKKPAAWIPLVLSVGALTLPWVWVLLFGSDPTGDEGGAAHIWQVLMAAQVLAIAYFAVRYLPQQPKQTLLILILQIAAILAAAAPVFILKL